MRVFAGHRTLGLSGCRKPQVAAEGSGSESLSPGPRPLRTARAKFPACRSSRWTGSDALSVSLAMAGCVEPLEVLSFITSPGVHRDAVMEMDLLSIEQHLATPRTLPPLGGGDSIEHAAFGHALTTHLAAPVLPVRFQGGIVRARVAFHLHVADNGDGRHPFESEADGLAASIATVRLERGAVLPDFEVSARGPPLRLLGVPAFRPAPQRPPDVVVHLLEGLFTDHMAVGHGPASEERVQMANDAFCGDGLMGFQP